MSKLGKGFPKPQHQTEGWSQSKPKQGGVKLVIGVDFSEYQEIDEETFSDIDDLDIIIDESNENMIVGQTLLEDVQYHQFKAFSFKTLSKIKRRVKSQIEKHLNKKIEDVVELFVIDSE